MIVGLIMYIDNCWSHYFVAKCHLLMSFFFSDFYTCLLDNGLLCWRRVICVARQAATKNI